jgi:long-chain alkane monooxygenase
MAKSVQEKHLESKHRNQKSFRTTPGVKCGRIIGKRKKKCHLLAFVQHGIPINHATGMWRVPNDKVNMKKSEPEYWINFARICERGLFDAIFIADELAPYTVYKGNSDACVKWAVQCPTHEPSTIVPIITTATKNLGCGVTLSTAFEHPYSMVRRLSSLDHLSKGRIAWNIVSCYSSSEWEAYGQQMSTRMDRYAILEEYMEVCYQLWDSWAPDAIVKDAKSGVYADPAKVKVVHHEGELFKCHARAFTFSSPQIYPVLWQAGSSNRGRDFAAKHSEAIFAVLPTVNTMKEYSEDLNNRLENKFKRNRGEIKLIFGLQTYVGATREQAQEKMEFIKSHIPLEGGLAFISGHFGLDFSKYKLDDVVQDIEVPGIEGLFKSIVLAKDGAPVTIKEAAMIYGASMGMPIACGTPKDIADIMEYYMDEGGADGFMLAQSSEPQCMIDIADWVVPELQRRGRYRTQYNGPMLRDNLLEY